ncbi:hypothetical protein [Sphingomonas trueperi]|uniref:hypothetical protein n=1 Tax=Sphingomonas trueperi TaxID=53317 RepID=UPI000EB20B3A
MFYQADLFDTPSPEHTAEAMTLPAVIERIAEVSLRPRYAFMVLQLIARAAAPSALSAGPYVGVGDRRIPLRDWLCDALLPMANRDARRLAQIDDVRIELERAGTLPTDAAEAARCLDEEVRERVRRSGRCNVSRAVSDLVRAGLVRRHYKGYRVDHINRGAQREVVYTILPAAAQALFGLTHT